MPTPSVAISVTSTPVWKARPSPVWTMTRTSGSRSSSFQATASSSRMAADMAFSCSARSLISHPTGPRRSTVRHSKLEYSMPRSLPGPSVVLFHIRSKVATAATGASPTFDQMWNRANLEGPPQDPLGGGHGRGRVAGDRLAQALGFLTQPLRGVHHLADHAELQGTRGGEPFVASDQGHAQDGLGRHLAQQPDGLVGGDLSNRHVRVQEGGVGRRHHDVGVGDEVQPASGSGSRGRPSTRSPRMFLLTSVVPPSMVFARLRSIPRTSRGSEAP